MNFGKKLIDFKLSSSSASSAPPQEAPPSSSPSSAPREAAEISEDQEGSSSPAAKPDQKHACQVCAKSFRYAATLARHERAHLCEETQAKNEEEAPPAAKEVVEEEEEEGMEGKAAELEAEEKEAEEDESDGGESGESEKEERSDEEASEPKSVEGGEAAAAAGGRVDKRKKICTECGKRFWSLQDLTRHMRSHTGRDGGSAHRRLLIGHRKIEP